jgi:ubiquinone/menaquinone biosynthesis C-methylase UbiE
VAFARAFNAAWNAHDVEGVVACFAPDATVRQTRARVADPADAVVAPPVIEDVYGAGPRALADAHDPGTWARGEVLWARGPAEIRAWLPPFFAAGHRLEAAAYRAGADVVTWHFRAFADPYQQVRGVVPAEGTAALEVRAGRAVALDLETDGETVARRARQFDAALSGRLAAAWAALRLPATASPRTGPPGPAAAPEAPARGSAAPDGPEPRLLLGLVGAAALAGRLARQRRRASAPGGPPVPAPSDGAPHGLDAHLGAPLRQRARVPARPVTCPQSVPAAEKATPMSPGSTGSPRRGDATYPLGRTDAETERLIKQAGLRDGSTRRLFEDAGLRPGMTVLDVGSGAGDVALLAAGLVGPTGAVVGVDVNPAVLVTARERAAGRGLAQVRFLEGDVRTIALPDNFDAAVGRNVLLYTGDLVEVVRAAAGHVRPGGIVAFQEAEFTLPYAWAAAVFLTPLMQQVWTWAYRVFEWSGAHLSMGMALHRTFVDAGLGPPEMSLHAPVGGAPDWPGLDLPADSIRSSLPLLDSTGSPRPRRSTWRRWPLAFVPTWSPPECRT